jgi:hypothetical protein
MRGKRTPPPSRRERVSTHIATARANRYIGGEASTTTLQTSVSPVALGFAGKEFNLLKTRKCRPDMGFVRFRNVVVLEGSQTPDKNYVYPGVGRKIDSDSRRSRRRGEMAPVRRGVERHPIKRQHNHCHSAQVKAAVHANAAQYPRPDKKTELFFDAQRPPEDRRAVFATPAGNCRYMLEAPAQHAAPGAVNSVVISAMFGCMWVHRRNGSAPSPSRWAQTSISRRAGISQTQCRASRCLAMN